MRISVWPDGSAPVYLDPSLREIVQLAEQRVDPLRICVTDEHVAIASGYGNTHDSVIKIARKEWGNRWNPEDLILFRDGETWFWNPMGRWLLQGVASGRVPLHKGYLFVSAQLKRLIEEFVSFHSQLV